jgi:hypothetical protein
VKTALAAGLGIIPSLVLASPAAAQLATSYVSPVLTAQDAEVLATSAVRWLTERFAPAQTTLMLQVPPPSKEPDFLTPRLVETFRTTGYGVVLTDAPQRALLFTPDELVVRYAVTNLNEGVLFRLAYHHRLITQYYHRRPNGTLITMAPATTLETPHAR